MQGNTRPARQNGKSYAILDEARTEPSLEEVWLATKKKVAELHDELRRFDAMVANENGKGAANRAERRARGLTPKNRATIVSALEQGRMVVETLRVQLEAQERAAAEVASSTSGDAA